LLAGLIKFLWYASIASGAAVVIRLVAIGLASRYRGLAGWAAVSALSSILLLFFEHDPDVYLWVFITAYALEAVCIFFMVRKLFSSHLEAYQGIGAFAQKLLSGLVGLSAVISVFAIRQDWLSAASPADWTFTSVRIVDTGFAVFLASAGIFFARYRVPTRRNVLLLEAGATVYFTIQALAFLAIILIGNPAKLPASIVVEAADFSVFLYCVFAVTQAGESLPARHYDPVKQARVEALNAEALRFAQQMKSAVRKNSG
jgi:hypothetical protein